MKDKLFSKMKMVNVIQQNRKFFNRMAKWYKISPFREINNRMLERVSQLINVKNNSRILDAGCGTGTFLQILYSEGKNLNLYGVDISEEMLKVARQKLGDNVELSLKGVEELDFDDNSFDYIFTIDAFHHYADQEVAIRNFYRILKKEGELIIVDITFGKIGNWISHYIEPGNTGMHTVPEFKQLFRYYNFKNVKQRKIGLFSVITRGVK